MNKIQTEPVLLAGTITGVIMAGLAMAVSLGWLNLNDGQMKSIETFVVGLLGLLVPIALAWWARRKVTPLAAPKMPDGQQAILLPKAEAQAMGIIPPNVPPSGAGKAGGDD